MPVLKPIIYFVARHFYSKMGVPGELCRHLSTKCHHRYTRTTRYEYQGYRGESFRVPGAPGQITECQGHEAQARTTKGAESLCDFLQVSQPREASRRSEVGRIFLGPPFSASTGVCWFCKGVFARLQEHEFPKHRAPRKTPDRTQGSCPDLRALHTGYHGRFSRSPAPVYNTLRNFHTHARTAACVCRFT